MAKSNKYINGHTIVTRRIYADNQRSIDEYVERIKRFKCRYKNVIVLNRFNTFISINGKSTYKFALDIQYELVSKYE